MYRAPAPLKQGRNAEGGHQPAGCTKGDGPERYHVLETVVTSLIQGGDFQPVFQNAQRIGSIPGLIIGHESAHAGQRPEDDNENQAWGDEGLKRSAADENGQSEEESKEHQGDNIAQHAAPPGVEEVVRFPLGAG